MAVFRVSVKWAKDELPHFQDIGGTIGTLVSGFFSAYRCVESNYFNLFN